MIYVRPSACATLGLLLLFAVTAYAQDGPPPADPSTVQMVEVDGNAVRVQVRGLEQRVLAAAREEP